MKADGVWKNLSRLLWRAVLLVSFTVGLSSIAFAAETKAEARNLLDLHTHVSKLNNQDCLACHTDIMTAVTLDPKVKTFHRLHLESKLATPKECGNCHQTVDLRNGSAGALRRQVDPHICASCHTGAMKDAKALYVK